VSGSVGGLWLKTNDANTTRPTSDRVKEAMFSIITPWIADACVLDLFAGNGALGIEALSRGASTAVFVDVSKQCKDIIFDNLVHTKLDNRAQVINCDWITALQQFHNDKVIFDIIILDPPYNKNLILDSLFKISEQGLCVPGAIAICEHNSEENIPETVGNFTKIKCRKYGNTSVSLFEFE